MKKFTLFISLCLFITGVFAQSNTDSLAYQLQRKKINGMLAQRAQKFGKYDQSLSMHTGIFGLQTKKDIRRSNEILMDIVKTDNAIYRQLKILLEYRTFQQTQVQSHSKEAEKSNLGFMYTISKLQQQNDKLKAQAQKQQNDLESIRRAYVSVIVVLLAAILYLIIQNYRRRSNFKTV
jgi:hypothetical protein